MLPLLSRPATFVSGDRAEGGSAAAGTFVQVAQGVVPQGSGYHGC